MKQGNELFEAVCLAEDPETEVGQMSTEELKVLDLYLQRYPSGIAGMVAGLIWCEAARRTLR